jgi:hypothetical protein
MIKANELRIGNLIQSKSNLCSLLEVRQLFGDSFQAKDIGSFMYESCDGIPITEEWLLKFGFECSDQQSWSTGEEVNYKVYKKGDLAYNSIQNAWWLRGTMNHYPEYVHELQNLVFALTGSELTIDNKH